MTILREAAQQALEFCEFLWREVALNDYAEEKREATELALRAALAQEQAEPTVKESLQVEPAATTQQPADEAPPSDYRRGYWDGFAIGKREGRIEAEDAAEQAEPKGGGNLPPPWRCACGANLYIDEYGHPASRAAPRYEKPQQDEPVQEPVAWMVYTEGGTSAYVTDNPNDLIGAYRALALYTTPPQRQRQPLSGLAVERLLEQVIGSLPVARNLVRAVERAHGIIESEIKGDSHQALDDAMQQPRAMAQAYENGYKAGAAAERERIIQFLQEMQRVVGDVHNHYGVAAVRIKEGV